MEYTRMFVIIGSILIAIACFFAICEKTRPIFVGVLAGGMTYVFFALLCLILGI